MKDCTLWEGALAGSWEECEEVGVSEKNHNELTLTSFPACSPGPPGKNEVEELGVKLSLVKKGRVGRRQFKVCSYCSLSHSI